MQDVPICQIQNVQLQNVKKLKGVNTYASHSMFFF